MYKKLTPENSLKHINNFLRKHPGTSVSTVADT